MTDHRAPTLTWLRPLAAAAALALTLGLSQAEAQTARGPMDFVFASETVPAPDAQGRPQVWKFGELSAVRRVPREAGSVPNQQPVQAEPEALRRALQSVEWGAGANDRRPLFTAAEAADLAPALARALAVATADEDVLVVSTARREGGLLVSPTTLTARVFVADGRVHLLVRDARADLYGPWRATRVQPTLNFPGRQAAQSSPSLRSIQAQARRADWLALDLSAQPASPPPLAAVSTPAAPLAALPTATPMAPAAPVAAVAPAAPPVAAPAPAPVRARDAAFYDEQAQRLAGLKRLRDQGLISEAEYEQKRRQVLEGL